MQNTVDCFFVVVVILLFFFFSRGGYQYDEYACMRYEIRLRVCFSQRVRYWYELCDIFHVLGGICTTSSHCDINDG